MKLYAVAVVYTRNGEMRATSFSVLANSDLECKTKMYEHIQKEIPGATNVTIIPTKISKEQIQAAYKDLV